jgi:hypothetical protein
MLTVKASMFHLQCIFFSEICCGKNTEATENGIIFQLLSIFQCSLTHSRVVRGAHQAFAIKAGVCCVRVCNFSIIASIDLVLVLFYKNLVKINCIPSILFSSLYSVIAGPPSAV